MKKTKKEAKSQMEIGTPEGGKVIQTPKADEAQTVEVRGTKRMLASKSKRNENRTRVF